VSRSRREERRGAAFLLYQHDLTGAGLEELYAAYDHDHSEPVSEFMRSRVEGAWDDREQIDRAIDAAAEGWSADRMAVLERSILRLAVWELRAADVPPAVAIDEAVELAKRYASPEAGALVNGVLGRIAREEGVGT
jgi:transcription antitermination protein NusB